MTPVLLDWFLEQRLGAAIEEPTLSITSPSQEPFYRTGATLLNLAGSAQAFRESITGVTWENPTSKAKGHAVGTNSWTATHIPLVSDKTNAIMVTATTPSSWTPAYGGTTTFSQTFFVLSTPVRASLALQPPGAVLNWTGGVAPFQVQRASALSGVNWNEMVTNAIPPLMIPVDQAMGFYRIVGQ